LCFASLEDEDSILGLYEDARGATPGQSIIGEGLHPGLGVKVIWARANGA